MFLVKGKFTNILDLKVALNWGNWEEGKKERRFSELLLSHLVKLRYNMYKIKG